MFKPARIISVILVTIITTGLLTSCQGFVDSSFGIANGTPVNSPPRTSTTENAPLSPIPPTPAIPIVLSPVASGNLVESNKFALLDYSNKEDGYIMVKWLLETDLGLRAQVIGPSEIVYTYRIREPGTFEVFPLSDGNGKYTIRVLEQIEGNQFALALEYSFSVELADEFAPFLRPNKYVNFSKESNIVAVAAELVTGQTTFLDKISVIYDFVAMNITYDVAMAEEIVAGSLTGYVPDLDAVLAKGYGICFDYAAVMTAMLRSQGIPTKLVFGFVGEVMHAWINVFSDESGWIDNIIYFDGESWTLMDPTFAAAVQSAHALRDFIGDGSSYIVQFLY